MSGSRSDDQAMVRDPFRHEGLFYHDTEEYLTGLVPFIHTGLEADEPVLVAVPGPNLELLRDALGADANRVRFRDMSVTGRNPGRIIPTVLLAFVNEHPSSRVRVIGEPIWAERTDTEYPACVQHEALINLAVAGRPATILCPYDASCLDPGWLADARGTHPILVRGEERVFCEGYADPGEIVAAYNIAMQAPAAEAVTLSFSAGDLPSVRQLVTGHGRRAGLSETQALELQIAAHEVAANTLAHTDGGGTLRIWREEDAVVCEIHDGGQLTDPLAGRRPAGKAPDEARGLLLVNALCDLVRMHTGPTSTTVRLYMYLSGGTA